MSTFGDLISDVKIGVRENTSEKDSDLLSAAGRLYREYLRSDDWPQTRVTGTVITIVSGTAAYSLPADFDRFAGDRMFYTLATNYSWPSLPVPILPRGGVQNDRVIEYWNSLNVGQVASSPWGPMVATVQAGSANTYQVVFYPTPQSSGDTITFDYYSSPSRTSLTTNTTIGVDQLYETLYNALCAQYYGYLRDVNGIAQYNQMARESHRNARQTLSRL
jgi:hypothetical protein